MRIIFILVHFQVHVFHLRDRGRLNIAVSYLQFLSSGRTYFATPRIWSSLWIASVSGRWQKPQRVSSKAQTSVTLQLLPLHFWGLSLKSARQWGSSYSKRSLAERFQTIQLSQLSSGKQPFPKWTQVNLAEKPPR